MSYVSIGKEIIKMDKFKAKNALKIRFLQLLAYVENFHTQTPYAVIDLYISNTLLFECWQRIERKGEMGIYNSLTSYVNF